MSTTKAPPKTNGNTTEAILYVAFELSDKSWKLGFTTGHGQKPRERNVTARDQEGILNEIAQAKRRLGLPETAPVVSCYEAGREGFWLHRLLHAHEITNHVVDSSAIEVSRRQRRAKSDGLDVRKLLSMLIRYEQGEHRVWQVVNVPSVEAEDHRHLHRDLETLKRALHEGVIYRHLILTVPAMFRTPFYQNAEMLLGELMKCSRECLDDFYSEVRGKALKGGYLTVIHTHGRNGQYHPHVHVLATSGGYDAQAESWEHLSFLPYDLLRHKWQWHLMTMFRRVLASETIEPLVDRCFKTYPNGLVSRVQRGQVPSQYQSLASYVAKYVVSPPISLRRIDRYDGRRVTYHYRSHRTERTTHETVDVLTFIGRMIQHTRPKGFKRIRYYGVQATKTFAQVKIVMQAALAKVEKVVKGAVKIIARLTYRERYEKSTGQDPLICAHCRGEMGLWRIWHPIYGVVYDEGERIKRSRYRSRAQQSDP